MSMQQQQLRVVKLDVIAPFVYSNVMWNMSRKLAMICHYLNTRCRTGVHFFNAGVTNKAYVNPNNPSDYDVDDETIYFRINDDFVFNNIDYPDSFGLLSNLMDDNEIRNCAQNHVNMIKRDVQGLSFININQ